MFLHYYVSVKYKKSRGYLVTVGKYLYLRKNREGLGRCVKVLDTLEEAVSCVKAYADVQCKVSTAASLSKTEAEFVKSRLEEDIENDE